MTMTRLHVCMSEAEIDDAIAEYWHLANDPAADLDPDLRCLLIDTARSLGAEKEHRLADWLADQAPLGPVPEWCDECVAWCQPHETHLPKPLYRLMTEAEQRGVTIPALIAELTGDVR